MTAERTDVFLFVALSCCIVLMAVVAGPVGAASLVILCIGVYALAFASTRS